MEGRIYLVATPIGNLKDITLRALETLENVDIIACEDSRHSIKLLSKYNIKKPLLSYHKHNEKQRGSEIIKKAQEGKEIAIISDAGMPCISDPGSEIVRLARENDIKIEMVPGASSLSSAIALSGIKDGDFLFVGFLPKLLSEKKEKIRKYQSNDFNILIYTPPHGLRKDMKALFEVLGERSVVLVKEITKINERVETTKLSSYDEYKEVKGEYIIIVKAQQKSTMLKFDTTIKEDIIANIKLGLSHKEAIKLVARHRSLQKDVVYKQYLEIKADLGAKNEK